MMVAVLCSWGMPPPSEVVLRPVRLPVLLPPRKWLGESNVCLGQSGWFHPQRWRRWYGEGFESWWCSNDACDRFFLLRVGLREVGEDVSELAECC